MEIVDIDVDIDGSIKPEQNDQVALVDTDTLAFTSCLNVEYIEELLPREMYSDNEWIDIEAAPGYVEEKGVIYHVDIDQAFEKAEEKLQRILDKTGCQTCELHFTTGRENFRYQVKEDYKGNRTTLPPVNLKAVKQKLLDKYGGSMSKEWEADDIVVYLKKTFPEKYILVALDKDVYNSLPGRHFNYYESGLYKIEMKWVEVSEDTARMWPYLQTITGDKTDNIQGCHGLGPKKALKFIDASMTEAEMWEGVVKAWESKGMTSIDAMITMNLVNMHLLQEIDNELTIINWIPDFSEDGTHNFCTIS
jgi:hypothetical protein